MGKYGRRALIAEKTIFMKGIFKMPTVIERIAAAEADAEALKKNAQEAARSAEAAAEDEAAASLKIAREEAKAGLALAAETILVKL